MPVEDRWLSVDDLMEYLGISRDTVYDWLAKKGMPGHKVGRLWKFKRAEIDTWVRAGSAAISDATSENEAIDDHPADSKPIPRSVRKNKKGKP